MSTHWCVNFDGDAGPLGNQPRDYVLRHGLKEGMWLMQYQYAHNGHSYQGHPHQVAATTTNWRAAGQIKPGDWLVAYLPKNTYFAVGEVIERRKRKRYLNQRPHKDTIKRTTQEHRHAHLRGIVEYADAGALYEDFMDPWTLPLPNSYSHRREIWKYSQRVDINKWEQVATAGVQLEGLADMVAFPRYRRAAFEIPESFFETIWTALQTAAKGKRPR